MGFKDYNARRSSKETRRWAVRYTYEGKPHEKRFTSERKAKDWVEEFGSVVTDLKILKY